MTTCIYWHRNDLRVHDNECLKRACNEYDSVIPLYIVDPLHYRMLDIGFRKSGITRYRYLCDTIKELRSRYQSLGGNIAIRYGNTAQIIKTLAIEYAANAIIFQTEVASEELSDEKEVRGITAALGIECISVWGRTLYHLDDIPYEADTIPLTSKAFRINTSKNATPRELISIPESIRTPSKIKWGAMPEEKEVGYSENEIKQDLQISHLAGETAALARLQYYTFDSELLTSYKWTRNKSLGMNYSSKLSPYLALGSLSPRMIYHQVKDYESSVKKNISTWWLIFELVWRDYFIFKTLRIGNNLFYKGGFKNKPINWNKDYTLFERWKKGETGIPFLDAHQIELAQTGFMSNRGRVNSASFFTQDYQLDWRMGAAWFEHCLIDYDVYVNWMNWHVQTFEIYYTNPVHQSLKYDKVGDYIFNWIPELSKLPHKDFHAPWILTDAELEGYGLKTYNRPVQIYKKWKRSINNIIKEREEK